MLSKKEITRLIRTKPRCPEHGNKTCVSIEAVADLPTAYGHFQIIAFRNSSDAKEHVAVIHGNVLNKKSIPMRIHSECLTGDAFSSLRCDCHAQLISSLKRIGRMRYGVLLYLRQEGRGIGLLNKIKAYMLQDAGLDTFAANRALGFKADERDFSIAAHMLRSLGITSVQLMTNNPDKIRELEEQGIQVTKRIPVITRPGKHNRMYLKIKALEGGHLLSRKKRA